MAPFLTFFEKWGLCIYFRALEFRLLAAFIVTPRRANFCAAPSKNR